MAQNVMTRKPHDGVKLFSSEYQLFMNRARFGPRTLMSSIYVPRNALDIFLHMELY